MALGMSRKNDGGPAFPVLDKSYVDRDDYTRYETEGGMTLRDYFAAKAMAGILSASPTISIHPSIFANEAGVAYAIADAMLAERNKETPR